MNLHLLGLPHTQTTKETVVCAFTAKLVKFCEMMEEKYNIFVYSGEDNDAPCVEHIPLVTKREQRRWYGDDDPNFLPSKATWDANDGCWRTFNNRAINAVKERYEPDDLILVTGGNAQRPVADSFPEVLSCEWAAGYEGIFSPYVCFESYAWMHFLYGKINADCRFFDAVIPNFFRPEDFAIGDAKGDYLLFVGRITERKGVRVASEVAMATGRKLLLAGSGVVSHQPGKVVCEELTLEGDHLEYVGPVNAEVRNVLMGRAHAVLVPTTYVEPFGAVAVEAQLCGTPAITTDCGAFTETVDPSYRFRTLSEAVEAVERAGDADPLAIQQNALDRFSLEAVAPKYENWFSRLSSLWGDGWYADTSYVKEETS